MSQLPPLREGRIAIADQAAARGLPIPVGHTVAALRKLGYDVDATWHDSALFVADATSPTGYVVRSIPNDPDYALAY